MTSAPVDDRASWPPVNIDLTAHLRLETRKILHSVAGPGAASRPMPSSPRALMSSPVASKGR